MRIRIRISEEIGKRLMELRPSLRGRIISLLISDGYGSGRIDLNELYNMRKELARLGTLINQSLRVSGGKISDIKSVEKASQIITQLIK